MKALRATHGVKHVAWMTQHCARTFVKADG